MRLCAKALQFGESPVFRKVIKDQQSNYRAWNADQSAKSEFFHEKLHEWGLLEIVDRLEQVKGEQLIWELEALGIAEEAWNKVIHSGIKPILLFAHPDILTTETGVVSYYRMLAMVSQKSMNNVGLAITYFEAGESFPSPEKAKAIAHHLNQIVSGLVQADEKIDAREFLLWRGMTAGAQAQGSWGNSKGKRAEIQVKGVLRQYLRSQDLIERENVNRLDLRDGRTVLFADEPDIAIYRGTQILAALEIKGGIDTAAILERVGAAVKSLSRAKEENPNSLTILLLENVSLTDKATADLKINQNMVNHWFTIDDFLNEGNVRSEIMSLLNLL